MKITNASKNQNNQIHNRKLYKQKRNLAVVHNGYSRTRTYDTSVNSRSLYQLSYTPVGCLLLTSFTLSALGYADYTKYRLLNLFLFVLQICGYLRFVISLVALPQHSGIKIYCDMLRSRVQESNLSALHLPRHRNTARQERGEVRRCSECLERLF